MTSNRNRLHWQFNRNRRITFAIKLGNSLPYITVRRTWVSWWLSSDP